MFLEAYEVVAVLEGGYSDNIHDSGGKTMYGVTERVARAWGYQGLMRDLPKPVAMEIFKEEYWRKIRLDELEDDMLANFMLDASVNHGQSRSVRLAQRAYNTLSETQIKEDGIIGTNTLKALNDYPDKFKLRFWFLNVRAKFFYDILNNNPSQKEFKNGWTNRLKVWYEILLNSTAQAPAPEVSYSVTPEEAIEVLIKELGIKRGDG